MVRGQRYKRKNRLETADRDERRDTKLFCFVHERSYGIDVDVGQRHCPRQQNFGYFVQFACWQKLRRRGTGRDQGWIRKTLGPDIHHYRWKQQPLKSSN